MDLHRCYAGKEGLFHLPLFNHIFTTFSTSTDWFYHEGSGVFSHSFYFPRLPFSQNLPVWEKESNILGGFESGCFVSNSWEAGVAIICSPTPSMLKGPTTKHMCAHAVVPFQSSAQSHCWGCIEHKKLKATEVCQVSLHGSPQEHPKELVINTREENVAEFLHGVEKH